MEFCKKPVGWQWLLIEGDSKSSPPVPKSYLSIQRKNRALEMTIGKARQIRAAQAGGIHLDHAGSNGHIGRAISHRGFDHDHALRFRLDADMAQLSEIERGCLALGQEDIHAGNTQPGTT